LPSFRKKLEPKEWVNGLGPGPGKGGQKNAKTSPLVTSPQQTPNQKQKFFLRCQLEDLLNL